MNNNFVIGGKTILSHSRSSRRIVIGRTVQPLVHEGGALYDIACFNGDLTDLAEVVESFNQEFDLLYIFQTDEPPIA